MKRVMFDGCAGWLHGSQGNVGVVMCAPQGHEMMWSHRAWRHLSDDMARAGLPVLRFDYRGTGDAADLPDGDNTVASAIDDIVAACAALCRLASVSQIVLCGLRLGASLAALAAARVPQLAGVVMLAPVIDGRLYLRELRALHAAWRHSAIPELDVPPPPDGAQDVLSFRLPPATVAGIQSIRLDASLPLSRVLLLDAWPDPSSPVAALAGGLGQAGADVELDGFDEYPDVMRSAEFADVPVRAWERVTGWIASRMQVTPPRRAAAVAPGSAGAPDDALAASDVVESPVWIDNARLFGVLCMPPLRDATPARPATAVIFPNTGGNHHVGDGRLFVTVSRQLARQGIAALRLDVSSIGDSPGAARQMDLNTIYGAAPRRDLGAAVDWLRARGFRCIVLAGICSGAFLSLHAALENPDVTGLMLVNLVKFRWDAADQATASDRLRPARVYLAAACRWENWRRLFRGELGLRRLLAAMSRRIRVRLREHNVVTATPGAQGQAGQTTQDFASAAVRELERRGVRTLFLYGASDVGLHEAHLGLGRRFEAIDGLRHVRLQTMPLLDHSLFLTESREAFAAQLLSHLRTMPQALASFRPVAPPAPRWQPGPTRKSHHGMAAANSETKSPKPSRKKGSRGGDGGAEPSAQSSAPRSG